MPACPDLAGAVVVLANADGNEFVLEYALAGHVDAYDYVFIDCPPSLGVLTVNALVAAARCSSRSRRSTTRWRVWRRCSTPSAWCRSISIRRSRILGVVVTMYDGRTRLGREVAGEVREHLGELVFQTVVPRNVRLSEAPSHGLPISRYDATCAGSDAYFDLAKEVVSRD